MNRLLGSLSAVAAFFILFLGGYCLYLKWQLAECKLKPAKEQIEAQEEYDTEKHKIMSLDDIALRREFCDSVRDDKKLCLQADIPISP